MRGRNAARNRAHFTFSPSRMALRARHRWVAAKVAESFGLSVEAAEDACKAHKAALDALFGGTQTKLIILFQPVLALRPVRRAPRPAPPPRPRAPDGPAQRRAGEFEPFHARARHERAPCRCRLGAAVAKRERLRRARTS